MSPSHEALLALLDSADGDGAHAPSPRESAGTGDTGTTSSYAMVDAGGVGAPDGRTDVSIGVLSAPVWGGAGLVGGRGSGGGGGGGGIGMFGTGGSEASEGALERFRSEGALERMMLNGQGLAGPVDLGGLQLPVGGTSVSNGRASRASLNDFAHGGFTVDGIDNNGGGGREEMSSMAGLDDFLDETGSLGLVGDGTGRAGGLNVTFAGGSRANFTPTMASNFSIGRSSPSAALLRVLSKQEGSVNGEDAPDKVSILLIDLSRVCGAPVGTAGAKVCLTEKEECSFRSHATHRQGRIDSTTLNMAYVILAPASTRGAAFIPDPILPKATADKVEDFDAFLDLLLPVDKWAEVFHLAEMVAKAGTEEDVQYRQDMLLRSARKIGGVTPLHQSRVEVERGTTVEDRLDGMEDSVAVVDGQVQGLAARIGSLSIEGTQFPTATVAIAAACRNFSGRAQDAAGHAVAPVRQEVARLKGSVISALAQQKASTSKFETAVAAMPSAHEVSHLQKESRDTFDLVKRLVGIVVPLQNKMKGLQSGGQARMVQGHQASQQVSGGGISALGAEVKRLEAMMRPRTSSIALKS